MKTQIKYMVVMALTGSISYWVWMLTWGMALQVQGSLLNEEPLRAMSFSVFAAVALCGALSLSVLFLVILGEFLRNWVDIIHGRLPSSRIH